MSKRNPVHRAARVHGIAYNFPEIQRNRLFDIGFGLADTVDPPCPNLMSVCRRPGPGKIHGDMSRFQVRNLGSLIRYDNQSLGQFRLLFCTHRIFAHKRYRNRRRNATHHSNTQQNDKTAIGSGAVLYHSDFTPVNLPYVSRVFQIRRSSYRQAAYLLPPLSLRLESGHSTLRQARQGWLSVLVRSP